MPELALELIREAKEKRLTTLDLGNCGLTELPDDLFDLFWLEELILSSTWTEYDLNTKTIDRKYSRNSKTQTYNNIIDITPIASLSNLKALYLADIGID